MVLEKTLRWTAIGALFLLPFIVLYVSRSLFFPFITGKNFAFRILIEIAGGAWLPLALVYPRYRPRRSWILWTLSAFVILIGISDALGVNPFKSFWSNFERMEGWVTLAHLLVYFIVASSLLTEKLWRAWWHASLGVSVIVALYGLLQLGGLLTINQGGVRLDATLGNATYLAIYMLFHIFIAAVFLARAWSERPRERTIYAVLYGAIMALDGFILFFTATRGAILGLLGGAVLAGVIFIMLQPRSRVAWRIGIALAALALLAGGFFLARDSAWVQKIGPLERLASISLTETTTVSRFYNWGMAWRGVEERPILGWGQENYAIVFDKYYDPRMYAQEPWFDRVHNIIFDWWVAGGTIGLLAYLSIFAATLYALWRSPLPVAPAHTSQAGGLGATQAGAFSAPERSIVTGLLAGYVFYNIFTFDNITSYILFIALLAWVSARAAPPVALTPGLRGIPEKALPVVAAAVVLLVWGSAWYVNASAIAQNRTLISAIGQHPEGIMKNLELFKSAIAYQSVGTQEAREQLAQGAARVASLSVDSSTKQAFFGLATQEMLLQEQASPLDARFPLFLGAVYQSYGDYADAAPALERAHERSPKKQAILFQMAANSEARGDSEGALALLQEAYELEPEYTDARIRYATALIAAGKDARADEVLAPIIETGEAADNRIASAYMARKRYDKAAIIWEARVRVQPSDAQSYFTLAAIYYAGGDSARAIATLQKAGAVVPGVKEQADQLIQQIRSGTARLN